MPPATNPSAAPAALLPPPGPGAPTTTTTGELVALVEDDPTTRKLVRAWLEGAGYMVVEYDSARAVREDLDARTTVACIDLHLGESSGFDVMGYLRERDAELPTIVITADGEVQTAVAAMRAGAYDYLTKPIDRDCLLLSVRRACERRRLIDRVKNLQTALGSGNAVRVDRRLESRDARALASGRTRARERRGGVPARRKRDGQGARRARHPSGRAAQERSVRRHQLRRHPGFAAGVGALRPRARRLHGRDADAPRLLRARPGRNPAARRGRRDEPRRPGRAAPNAAGTHRAPSRRKHGNPDGRAHRLRHASRPAGRGRRRPFPRGPLLPPGRLPDPACRRCATASRTSRSSSRTFSKSSARAVSTASATSHPTRSKRCRVTPGPATCASSRTWCTAACSPPAATTSSSPTCRPISGRSSEPAIGTRAERGARDDEDDTVVPLRELEERAIKKALRVTRGSVGRAAKLLGIGRATLYRRIAEIDLPMSVRESAL